MEEIIEQQSDYSMLIYVITFSDFFDKQHGNY